MSNPYVVIEDDKAYIEMPITNYFGDVCGFERELVITKELFVECYKKWILNEQPQTTD